MKNLYLLQRKEKLLALALALAILSISISCYAYQNQNLIATLAIISLVLTYALIKTFVDRLDYLTELTKTIDSGKMPAKYDETKEVGIIGYLKSMHYKMQEIISFVQVLGEGEFKFKHIDPDGKIGSVLINLSQKQQAYVEEERKRNWKNEGLVKFGELLRMDDQDLKQMSLKILSSLVKYIDANQGGFFIMGEQEGARYMELTACYAYDRKKFVEARIEEGQGILGQVMLEKEIIYLTDIPANFTHITSGLGDATPKNIVIVPLIVNDKFYGVIEMASFTILPPYKIDFIKELAANIAASVASVKINENTKQLLLQSQALTESLHGQEEELRQSMEEMTTTQEALDYEKRKIQNIINALPLGVVTIAVTGDINLYNETALRLLQTKAENIKGKPFNTFFKFLKEEHLVGGKKVTQKVVTETGSTFMAELIISEQTDNENKFIVSFRDVTIELKKQQELMTALEQLEQLNKS